MKDKTTLPWSFMAFPRSAYFVKKKYYEHFQGHIKKAMDKGLYTLEDGELVPEPVLSETPAPPTKPAPPAGKGMDYANYRCQLMLSNGCGSD